MSGPGPAPGHRLDGGRGKTTLLQGLGIFWPTGGTGWCSPPPPIWAGSPGLFPGRPGGAESGIDPAERAGAGGLPGPLGPEADGDSHRLVSPRLEADHILVEADGSRGLPLKYHRSFEPVVRENRAAAGGGGGLSALTGRWGSAPRLAGGGAGPRYGCHRRSDGRPAAAGAGGLRISGAGPWWY